MAGMDFKAVCTKAFGSTEKGDAFMATKMDDYVALSNGERDDLVVSRGFFEDHFDKAVPEKGDLPAYDGSAGVWVYASASLSEMERALGWCDGEGCYQGAVSIKRETLAEWVRNMKAFVEAHPCS